MHSLGKEFLAFRLEEEVIGSLNKHGMPRIRGNTITDQEEFLEEFEEIRENKYSVDQEERLSAFRCIGSPITDSEDKSIAAISILCPVHRINDEQFFKTLPNEVLGTANLIEIKTTIRDASRLGVAVVLEQPV